MKIFNLAFMEIECADQRTIEIVQITLNDVTFFGPNSLVS